MRDTIIKIAQSYIGCGNGDAKHKELLYTYNNFVKNPKYTYNPAPRTHQMTVGEAWCATFVSAIGILAGAKEYPCECSCNNQIKQLKNAKMWEESDSYVPQKADIIYYDWDDSGSGDNTGTADHVGIVEKVENGKITVIEGNKSNKCARRTLAVNGKYIRGFGKIVFMESVEAKPNVKAWVGKVTPSNGLNVRTEPNTNCKKLGALKKDTKITILGEDKTHEWGMIVYGGKTGWVCLDYVKMVNA